MANQHKVHASKISKLLMFLINLKNNKELLLMSLPGFIVVFVISYLPMVGIIVAFQNYNYIKGIFGSEFIGLKNFEFFFTSQYASRVIFNTIFLNFLFIATVLACSLALALVLKEIENKSLLKFVQSSIYLPNVLSYVAIGYFAIALFNPNYGVLNYFLKAMGIEPIEWYNEPKYWPVILNCFNLWKQMGVNTLIYLAAMISIPNEHYEAAKIDGASKPKMIFHITLPAIIPVISVLLLVNIGSIFRSDFGLFYNVTGNVGTLYQTTDVIDTFVIRSLRVLGDIGMSSAAGAFQSVTGFIIVLATNAVIRKINPENSLF